MRDRHSRILRLPAVALCDLVASCDFSRWPRPARLDRRFCRGVGTGVSGFDPRCGFPRPVRRGPVDAGESGYPLQFSASRQVRVTFQCRQCSQPDGSVVRRVCREDGAKQVEQVLSLLAGEGQAAGRDTAGGERRPNAGLGASREALPDNPSLVADADAERALAVIVGGTEHPDAERVVGAVFALTVHRAIEVRQDVPVEALPDGRIAGHAGKSLLVRGVPAVSWEIMGLLLSGSEAGPAASWRRWPVPSFSARSGTLWRSGAARWPLGKLRSRSPQIPAQELSEDLSHRVTALAGSSKRGKPYVICDAHVANGSLARCGSRHCKIIARVFTGIHRHPLTCLYIYMLKCKDINSKPGSREEG